MSTRSFLGGRITFQKLPFYAKPPGDAAAADLKRLALAQGELAQFWNFEVGMRYIASVEIVPAAKRGNHLHQRKQENLYVIAGKMLLSFKDPITGEAGEIEMQPGALVRIEPGIAHALTGLEPGYAIECSPTVFDAADSERYHVA